MKTLNDKCVNFKGAYSFKTCVHTYNIAVVSILSLVFGAKL